MRISDWSSDVCSSDLYGRHLLLGGVTVSGSLTERTDFDKVGDVRYVSSDYAGADIPEQSGITSWHGVLTTNVSLGVHTLTAIGGFSKFDTRRFPAYDERSPDGTVDRKSPRLNSSH